MIAAVSRLVPSARLRLSAHASLALLTGLHGLLFATIFPLGPQVARVWRPGVLGFAALTCALPLAAAAAGLVARRSHLLPVRPRTLALLCAAAALPGALARVYDDLLVARLLGGVVIGVSLAAVQRLLPVSPQPGAARLIPRVTTFGLPLGILAATALDWRAASGLVVVAALALAFFSPAEASPAEHPGLREGAPAGLAAAAALSFVSAAYLTVVSGFLVFNAGHTEWHIVAVLTLAAALSFAVPPSLRLARRVLRAPVEYELTLVVAALSLLSLFAISRPCPAWIAVPLIALFLNANAARHVTLAGLVAPRVEPALLAAHQAHVQLAFYLGAGLGCVCAGLLVHIEPGRGLVGMGGLAVCGLAATALAAFAPRFLPRLRAI